MTDHAIPIRPTVGAPEPPPETHAAQVKRLQAELAALAETEMADFMAALEELTRRAAAIGSGDIHKPGIRDLARRLAEDCAGKAQTLQAISGRGK